MNKACRMMLAVLLSVVLSLCGCAGDGSGRKLIGTWALEYDLSGLLAEEMGDAFAGFGSPLVMSVHFAFREDGTFSMYGEQESFRVNFAKWSEEFVAFGAETVYAGFAREGIGREAADELFQKTYNDSVEGYLRGIFKREMDADSLLAEIASSGRYGTSGNQLYMAAEGEEIDRSSYDVFAVSGDALKLELPPGTDESEYEIFPGLRYPLTLQRVD